MGYWRIALAIILLLSFMAAYSWLLWDMMYVIIPDQNSMQRYLIRSYSFKVIIFSAYAASNCIMTRSYKTQFENEILLTGIFSIIFITVITLLHYTHILIMPSQWNLILFNLITIAFFLIVYRNGKKHNING